jgi:hypothetical protein
MIITTHVNLDREELIVYEKIVNSEPKGIDLHTLIFEIAIENQMYSSEDIEDIIEDLEKMELVISSMKKCEENGDELVILHSV